ncbi:hypothetical protein PMAYCL1PPCAC_19975, partial [Pristionchus mayeri]
LHSPPQPLLPLSVMTGLTDLRRFNSMSNLDELEGVAVDKVPKTAKPTAEALVAPEPTTQWLVADDIGGNINLLVGLVLFACLLALILVYVCRRKKSQKFTVVSSSASSRTAPQQSQKRV